MSETPHFIAMGVANPSHFAQLDHVPNYELGRSDEAAPKPDARQDTAASLHPALAKQYLATLAAIIELVSMVTASRQLNEAGQSAVDAIKRWTDADEVSMYWQPKPGRASELIGESAPSRSRIREGESVRHAAAEEVMSRPGLTDSSAVAPRDQICLLATKRYAKLVNDARVLGVALRSEALGNDLSSARNPYESCLGSVLLKFDRPVSENEATELQARLDTLRPPLFHAISKVASTEPSKFTLFMERLFGKQAARKRQWVLAGAAIVVGILMIPMPYQAPVRCQLQPVGRRYVDAPIAGPLKSVFVRPGDDVQQGELLARIDSREIEMELAGKKAELQRSQQEHKGYLAQHKIGESKLASLRVERLQSEVALLQHRRERLEIVAPIAGVVVTGDWKRSEGTPVERGETLFEIAPQGDFNIEIAVEEPDVLHVKPGMTLQLRLDAVPDTPMTSVIERVHPRSELRDHDNVFLADARLVDDQGSLRPGMRGTGHVETDQHSIGWNLFHKAYYHLTRYLGV